MKKIIILCMLIAALTTTSACSQNGNNNGDNQQSTTTTQAEVAQNPEETTQAELSSEELEEQNLLAVLAALPEADYENYEFRIWTSNKLNDTLEARQVAEEELNGEPVNDALYKRDRLIEEKYNIKIKYTLYQTNDPAKEISTKALKSIKANDDAFDLAMENMMQCTKSLAQNGVLIDFNQMPNVDLSKDWWSKYAMRDLTIDGKFYFPTGDITPRTLVAPYVILFNKKMFTDLSIEYPYQTVLDGKWTLDGLMNISKDHMKDLNGDGVFDKTDSYGMIVETMSSFCFFQASGEGLVKIVDGNPVLNLNNERAMNVMNKLSSYWSDPNYVYYPKDYSTYDEVPMFKEDRVLFTSVTGSNIAMFRDMQSDFGILPMPKYDETQSEYYSYAQPWCATAVSVPITTVNLERTGMITEAMAAVSKYTSTPAGYEVTLKKKYSRDGESETVLDLIRAGACYDFAFMYNWGGIYDAFVNATNKGESFVSKFESLESKAQAGIDKTILAFTNN